MAGSMVIDSENVDIDAMIRRREAKEIANKKKMFDSPGIYSVEKQNSDLRSFFFDPLSLEKNYYNTVKTISPYYGRQVSYKILRRVSEKCWLINLCISTTLKQARPYFKESTGENQRGFRIKNKNAVETKRDMKEAEKKESRRLVDFLLKTGDAEDLHRKDDLDKYTTKIIRDLYQLDQISTELQYTRGNELCAFWAIDTATIEMALPNTVDNTGIEYVQVVNHVPYAYYPRGTLIFDCLNPRTDIEKAGYGYSVVEQAIDLVTSSINTFIYNSGFFTENKLPRGFLLLNGPADQEEIEDIEDYITNLMSGPPSAQWRVPIIPSGRTKNSESGGRIFEWVNLQGTNKEMEFQSWMDFLGSAIVAMFGKSMEELGLHSSKSQPLIGTNDAPKMEASKSLGLGDLLTYMQKHFNQIIQIKNPDFCLEFIGYEKDDLKLVSEIDREEIGSWKTLNEKRREKGLEDIDLTTVKNPADIPQSPQTVQMWQGLQQSAGMGGSPFGMTDDEGFEEGEDMEGDESEGSENDAAQAENGDNIGWDEIEAQGGAVEKSMANKKIIRIVV